MFKLKSILLFIALLSISFSYAYAFDNIDIDYNCGDKTYFHSDYLSDIGDTYSNLTAYPKENILKFNRCLERYNPNRTDNTIYMEKINTNDCHFDVGLAKSYPYVLIRAYAQSEKLGGNVRLCYVRGFDGAVNQDAGILKLTATGNITLSDGTVIHTVKENEWFHYAVGIDVYNHKADVYINNVFKCRVDFNLNIDYIRMSRIWIDTTVGTGSIRLDKYEITASEKPYTNDESNYTSVFHSNDGIKAYLSDKTAFHAFSGSVSVNGVKSICNIVPVYDEALKELFVSVEALNTGYNLDVSESDINIGKKTIKCNGITYELNYPTIVKDGYIMIPVKSFAKKVLSHQIFDDNNGLVITSVNTINPDLESETEEYRIGTSKYPHTNIKSLNWYMFFERPTASEIEEKLNSVTSDGQKHPRILATESDFQSIKIKRSEDKYLNELCLFLINKADEVLLEQPLTYVINDKQRILPIARELLKRMEYLGFAYQITGEQKYVDCAWLNLEKAGDYPDWNPSHMIDVGELNFAFALGFDWMYDGYTQEQRNFLFHSVKDKGLNVTRLAYYGRLGGGSQLANTSDAFVKWKGNFNTVINGGAIAAAAAFSEYDSGLCFDVLEKALRSLEYTMLGCIPDGAWIEGATYWDYMMSYLSKGIGALMTSTGTDFGFMKFQGMDKTALYYRSLDSFLGSNNFHDSSAARLYSSRLLWLVKLYDQPAFYAARKAQIDYSPNIVDIYDAIWYENNLNTSEDDLPLDVYFRTIECFSSRSSYADKYGMYVSAHGGPVTCYHSQADAGTFVYDALGERWVCDLGMEDYNVQRDGDGGFYSAYRRRAEAHNVIVINPNTSSTDGGQVDTAFVPMKSFVSDDNGAHAVYDMTEAYEPYVDVYERSFYTNRTSSSLVIKDELCLKNQSEINWFMTTVSNVEVLSNNRLKMTQNGKEVYLEFTVNGGNGVLSTTDCSPLLSLPVLSGQNNNTGYKRIRLKITAEGECTVVAAFTPVGGSEYTLKEPLASYDFGSAIKNTVTSVADLVSGEKATVNHTPDVFVYDVAEGVFGRDANDRSLKMWNKEEYTDYSDLYQFYCYDFKDNGRIATGQASEISFYVAYDGSTSNKYIDAFIYTDNTGSNDKHASMFCLNGDGTVSVWGKTIPKLKLVKEKWYKISVVTIGGRVSDIGNPNRFTLYIDDEFVYQGSFIPNWRGSAKDKFLGFGKIWIGQQIAYGEKTADKTYKTSNFYLDDLQLVKHENPETAVYTPVRLSHSDYNIQKNIVYNNGLIVYTDDITRYSDLVNKFTGADVTIVDKSGNIVSDITKPLKDLFIRVKRKNGAYLYSGFLWDNEFVFQYDVPEPLANNMFNPKFSAVQKSFTTLKYPGGIGGKSDNDYSMIFKTAGYNGTAEQNDPYISQYFTSSYYHLKPVHISFDVFMDETDCNAPINIYIMYKDYDEIERWCKIAQLKPDGRIVDMYGVSLAEFTQGKWVNVSFSFYPAIKACDIRIDGETVKAGIVFNIGSDFKEFVRYKVEQVFPVISNSNFGGIFGFDNFYIYKGAYIKRNNLHIYNVKSLDAKRVGENINMKAVVAGSTYNTPLVLIVAMYRNGVIEEVNSKEYEINVSENSSGNSGLEKTFELEFSLEAGKKDGSYVKIMLWDGMNSMMPLSAGEIIE